MRVNKATDTVAGHLFSCPNVFRKTPEGQWLLDSHAALSNISKFSLQFVEGKYDMSDLEVHLKKGSIPQESSGHWNFNGQVIRPNDRVNAGRSS